ncbi:UDP-N-acetylmuramoyl-L-alanine--D-glutamate ligase [bacterium]|nr:UDP-N-acetylmuramoyl-L-alanine--D-glutamate ligase [bacterium]
MTKKYGIIGLGITGMALADYFARENIPFYGFEEKSRANFEAAQKKYPNHTFYFENFPDVLLDETQSLMLSPGIPYERSYIKAAQQKKIPLEGELELASQKIKGQIVAVTGTNGKSTTVSLIHHTLNLAGDVSSLKGNIGSPLITAVHENPKSFYVVEVSSYQLETIKTFKPKISIMLNVTADHLERYDGMNAYAAAKERIYENQNASDFSIINQDDPYGVRMIKACKAQVLTFSLVSKVKEGGYVDGHTMVINCLGRHETYNLKEASLVGLHNYENMLAATLALTALGISQAQITKGLQTFKALPHRLELVGNYKGVKYYDDSKGTNVGSVVMSLASFENPVLLIMGGRDKGGDYAPLKGLVKGKVKHLAVMGEARDIIEKAFLGVAPLTKNETMKEAVEVCVKHSSAGDVVLLSPGCSSFDQYKNYAERGDDFKKWVEFYAK